jgi:hypothetical protein
MTVTLCYWPAYADRLCGDLAGARKPKRCRWPLPGAATKDKEERMNILLAFKPEPDAGMLAEKDWQAAALDTCGPDVAIAQRYRRR